MDRVDSVDAIRPGRRYVSSRSEAQPNCGHSPSGGAVCMGMLKAQLLTIIEMILTNIEISISSNISSIIDNY